MLITPADLVPDPLSLNLRFEPSVMEYAPDIRQTGFLYLKGSAERIEEHRGPREIVYDIRLRARFKGDFELLCARCLEPIAHHLDERFDLIFRPVGVDAEQGERSISEAETEIGYYEQDGLLVEDAVREQVLLSLPERSLCQENCKGLCAHCGGNLNVTACKCMSRAVDQRWAALGDLANDERPV